jgi:hypothetical protein
MITVRTIADMNSTIIRRMTQIPEVDMIVGIPRSGILAASMLSLHQQKPMMDLPTFREKKPSVKRILLLDDSYNMGHAMDAAVQSIKKTHPKVTILKSAIFVAPHRERQLDFAFEVTSMPRVFPWNLWRSVNLRKTIVDMDGVLCRNPTKAENANEDLYQRFLETAESLFTPLRPVRAIVTCRLEKYREITEEWLRIRQIRYGHLVMVDLPTPAARRAWGKHGHWKAAQYTRLKGELFVESCPKQAAIISRAGPVFCTESQTRFP